MSDLFTDADVERAAPFLRSASILYPGDAFYREGTESVLAATLPAIRARWLRELAETPHIHPLTREWLLSMAEAEER